MINMFKIKKYVAIILACAITSSFYGYGNIYGMFGGLIGMLIGMFLSLILANVLLVTPNRMVEEGDGLRVLDINSTGFIQPYIVKVIPPILVGQFGNKKIIGHYDRKITYNFKTPLNGVMQKDENGDIHILLKSEDFTNNRFSFNGAPTLIFNSMTGAFLNKDFFAEQEKKLLSIHSILLYMNENVSNLVAALKDFSRYAINSLGKRDLGAIFKNKFVIILIVILLGGLALVFFPQIMESLRAITNGLKG